MPGKRGRSEPGAEGKHVPFPGEPLVGLLDVGLAGAPADPQDAVRVEIPRRGLRSQGRQQQSGGPGQARPPQLHGSGGQRAGGGPAGWTPALRGTGDRARAADRPPSPTLRRRFRRARPAVTIETAPLPVTETSGQSGDGGGGAMEEAQRRALRRGRARLVASLRVAPLWDPLEDRGLFTRPMVEELQVGRGRAPGRAPCLTQPPGVGPREGPVSSLTQ